MHLHLGRLGSLRYLIVALLSQAPSTPPARGSGPPGPDDATSSNRVDFQTTGAWLMRRTRSTLAAEAGMGVSTVSEILSGKRRLALTHIAALARFFGVKQAVFLED
jgi:transcriptional regulator with XRE-family HTH domain